MEKVFTNIEHARWLREQARLKRPYWYGTYYLPCTETLLTKKAKQYPTHYKSDRMARYRQDIKNGQICGDCVNGAIKGAIWSELGPCLDAFPTESHFVSYVGVAPALGKSAGKNVSSRKKHKNTSRVGLVLKLAASTLTRSESSLGARLRCTRSRTCSRTAIKDVAREMAKRIYRGLRFGQAYVDEGEQAYLERTRERTIKSMKKKILKLGISAKELGIFAA